MTTPKQGVYVELDVLLDTRLGTIARISEDAAIKTLENGYHTREIDMFEFVDTEAFKTLYAQRDSSTLSKSMCSGAIELIRDLVGLLSEQAQLTPYHSGARVVVNTYPYSLSAEEQSEIGKAIAVWMNGLALVELVDLKPEELTPNHCKSNFAMMLMYEYEHWMEMHTEAFRTTQLPEVKLLVPMLYFKARPSAEELAQCIKEAAHPMHALEIQASPLIGLQMTDVKYFSVLTK
jgi:hypothetical protein